MPIIHLAANVLLIITCFSLGLLAFRKSRLIPWLITLGVAFMLLGRNYLVRPDLFVRYVPWQDWVFYRNFFAFGAAAMVPALAALAKSRAQRIRVLVLGFALFIVSLLPYQYYLIPNAESGPSKIDDKGMVEQTSFDSCSAAAAATLLRAHRYQTTEAEVIGLAYTKKGRGTDPLGLYRALRILTRDREDLTVRFEFLDVPALIERNRPAVITVGLHHAPRDDEERELVDRFRWKPFVSHSVVFMGVDPAEPDWALISDPSMGFERWPVRHLELLFRGPAFSLEKSSPGRVNLPADPDPAP